MPYSNAWVSACGELAIDSSEARKVASAACCQAPRHRGKLRRSDQHAARRLGQKCTAPCRPSVRNSGLRTRRHARIEHTVVGNEPEKKFGHTGDQLRIGFDEPDARGAREPAHHHREVEEEERVVAPVRLRGSQVNAGLRALPRAPTNTSQRCAAAARRRRSSFTPWQRPHATRATADSSR